MKTSARVPTAKSQTKSDLLKEQALADKRLSAAIGQLEVGDFLTLQKVPEGGSLQARRISAKEVVFYWRYTSSGKSDRVRLGAYDSKANGRSITPTAVGYSIVAAVRKCEEYARIHRGWELVGGYRAYEAESQEEARRKQSAAIDLKKHTLRGLLSDYCKHLAARGQISSVEAGAIFRLHVFSKPIANAPAASVSATDIVDDLLRPLVKAEKRRTANKLRSYLGAAYAAALTAKFNAAIPAEFKGYKVAHNPVAEIPRDKKGDKADKRPLTAVELGSYWKSIKELPGVKGAALRLHLLTGGQRISQLVRLQRENTGAETIKLIDAKGRTSEEPREHLLPLIAAAKKDIEFLKVNSSVGSYIFSTDGGKTQLNNVTLSKWAQKLKHGITDFQLKRVRSGVETALSAARVSKEIRGRLLSHGISGVQSKNYDGHDYLAEKTEALELLYSLLEPPAAHEAAKVVPIKQAKRTA
jgi:integrase